MYVLLFFVDALSYSYVKNRRNSVLDDLAQKGFRAKMKTILGYSAAITPTIWSGTYPRTHGYWAEFYHQRLPSGIRRPYRFGFGDKIGIWINYLRKYVLTSKEHREHLVPGLPGKLVPLFERNKEFSPTPHWTDGVVTLFDILFDQKIPYFFYNDKTFDCDYCPIAKTESPIVEIRYITALDYTGHRFGPASPRLESDVLRFDSLLRSITRRHSNTRDFHLLVLSDHGMTQIMSRLNLLDIVNKLGFTIPNDYVPFYDSTMARFWFYNSKARESIVERLSKLREGVWLSSDYLDKSEIGCNDKYGDLIFLVHPGIEIFPNFFHGVMRNFTKGAHGYDPDHVDSYGTFLYHGDLSVAKEKNEIALVDVLPTLLDILDLPILKRCAGKSLFR